MGESLLWAVKNGDITAVKQIVDTGNVNLNSELLNGRMALHYAADYGQSEVISYLIQKGADVNLKDRHGISPLLAAIWEGHKDAVKVLLASGAKKDGKAPDGSSYLDSAESEELKALLR